MASETADGAPRGYVSEQAKRRFCTVAGLLGGGAFIAQFALPMAIMLVLMPGMMMGRVHELTLANVPPAVGWQGSVWTLAETFTAHDEEMKALVRFNLDEEGGPVEVGTVDADGLYLLPDGDRLWLIQPDRLAYYRDGEVTRLPVAHGLGEMTRPFMHRGEPTVATATPSSVVLRHLRDGVWEEGEELRVDTAGELYPLEDKLQLLSAGGVVHVFAQMGDTVYHQVGVPAEAADEEPDWEAVDSRASEWSALTVDGVPAVVTLTKTDASSRVSVWKTTDDGGWRRFLDRRVGFLMEFGACTLTDPDRLLLLCQGFPGRFRVLNVRQGAVEGERTFGRSIFPLGGRMFLLMMVPHAVSLLLPLALALILTLLMAKYRTPTYTSEGRSALQASLIRRGVAEVVDAAIAGAPMLIGFLSFASMFAGLEDGTFRPESMFPRMGLVLLSIPWLMVCFVIYTIWEGTSGRTPGKLLLGIRVVGTDLKRCGIGRAFVRNLLKVVDGFFYWLVGVLLVALTENWQRLGDMAARTIVVRTSGLRDSAGEETAPPPVDPRFSA